VGGPQAHIYGLFDPENHEIHRLRHAQFDETHFPGFILTDNVVSKIEAVLLHDNDARSDNTSELGSVSSESGEYSGFISALKICMLKGTRSSYMWMRKLNPSQGISILEINWQENQSDN
jgi:hypothetical protein